MIEKNRLIECLKKSLKKQKKLLDDMKRREEICKEEKILNTHRCPQPNCFKVFSQCQFLIEHVNRKHPLVDPQESVRVEEKHKAVVKELDAKLENLGQKEQELMQCLEEAKNENRNQLLHFQNRENTLLTTIAELKVRTEAQEKIRDELKQQTELFEMKLATLTQTQQPVQPPSIKDEIAEGVSGFRNEFLNALKEMEQRHVQYIQQTEEHVK